MKTSKEVTCIAESPKCPDIDTDVNDITEAFARYALFGNRKIYVNIPKFDSMSKDLYNKYVESLRLRLHNLGFYTSKLKYDAYRYILVSVDKLSWFTVNFPICTGDYPYYIR